MYDPTSSIIFVIVILVIVVLIAFIIGWAASGAFDTTVNSPPLTSNNSIVSTYPGSITSTNPDQNTNNLLINTPGITIYTSDNPLVSSNAYFLTQTRAYWGNTAWTIGSEISTQFFANIEKGNTSSPATQLSLYYPTVEAYSSDKVEPNYTDLQISFNVDYIKTVYNGYYVDPTTIYNRDFDYAPASLGGPPVDIYGPSSGSIISLTDYTLLNSQRPVVYWTANLYDADFKLVGYVKMIPSPVGTFNTGELTYFAPNGETISYAFSNAIRVCGAGAVPPPVPTREVLEVITPGPNWPTVVFNGLYRIMNYFGIVYTVIQFTGDLYVNGFTTVTLNGSTSVQNSGDSTLESSYFSGPVIDGFSDVVINTSSTSSTLTATIVVQPTGTQTITTQIPIPIGVTGVDSDLNVLMTLDADHSALVPGPYTITFNLSEFGNVANPPSLLPEDQVLVVNINSIIVPNISPNSIGFPMYIYDVNTGLPVGNGYYYATVVITPIPIVSRGFSRLRDLFVTRDVAPSVSDTTYVDWFGPGQPGRATAEVDFIIDGSFLEAAKAIVGGHDLSINFGVYNAGTTDSPVPTAAELSFTVDTSVNICGGNVQVTF